LLASSLVSPPHIGYGSWSEWHVFIYLHGVKRIISDFEALQQYADAPVV